MSEPVPPTGAHGADPHAPWSQQSLDLYDSLMSTEAGAAQLRRELDDLRRSLDAAPAGAPARRGQHRQPRQLLARDPLPALPAGHHRARHRYGTVATVLLAVAVVGGGVTALARAESAEPQGSPAPAAAPAPSTVADRSWAAPSSVAAASNAPAPSTATLPDSPSQPARSSAPVAPVARVAAAAPLPVWPGSSVPAPSGLPSSGPGANAAGTELTAELTNDRSVEVYERALLTRRATLVLRQPVLRTLAAARPVVADLHAAVDGRPVPVTRTATGWTIAPPSAGGQGRLVLRYRLDGALVRHVPAASGRYDLVLTPLAPSAGGGADAAVLVRVDDERIDQMYCPTASNQLCGATNGSLHTATVPQGVDPVVLALVTL